MCKWSQAGYQLKRRIRPGRCLGNPGLIVSYRCIAYNWCQRPNNMKFVLATATVCAILLAAGCSQSPEKLLATANKYHENKKYDEASILYQKILVKDKTNAEAYYRLGLNALDQGNARGALDSLRRAVDLKPTNTDAEVKLAEINVFAFRSNPAKNKSFLNDAIDLDNKILQQNPQSFDGLRIQGMIALVSNDGPKALESFSKANRVKPYSRDLITMYAQILVQSGKTDEALSLVRDTLAHDRTWNQGYDILIAQNLRTNQRDKAEQLFKEHIEADPTSAIAIEEYANYRVATGDFAGGDRLMQGMLTNPKAFPGARMMLGVFYERAKKPELALAAYQQGAKDDTKNSMKYQERIVALQAKTNHPEQALSMAKDLAGKNPKDSSPNELYSELLLRTATRATMAKAVEDIRKMADANPTSSLLRLNLAKAYLANNDRDKSLASAQDAVAVEQKARAPRSPVIAAAQTLEARLYNERGDQAKALEQATQALASHPGDPDATLIKDKALIAMGKPEGAQSDLEALVKTFPNASEPMLVLGNLYLNQHLFDRATAQFEAASKANPADTRGFVGLQTVKLVSGHSTEALQGLQDLVSKNPSDQTSRYELANFQEAASRIPANQANSKQLLKQSADNFKEILKTNSTSSDVWSRLGTIQSALGETDAALASFEQAATSDPKNWAALLNEAVILDGLNRKKEAIDTYNKVLNIKSDNTFALNNLAYITAESGTNLDQAQTYAERAKKQAPESPDISDTLGYVYLQKNLTSQAAEIFRQNVATHPDNPAYRFHLAMALLKQGDKQGAREQAGKALQGATPDLQNKIKTFVGQIG